MFGSNGHLDGIQLCRNSDMDRWLDRQPCYDPYLDVFNYLHRHLYGGYLYRHSSGYRNC